VQQARVDINFQPITYEMVIHKAGLSVKNIASVQVDGKVVRTGDAVKPSSGNHKQMSGVIVNYAASGPYATSN